MSSKVIFVQNKLLHKIFLFRKEGGIKNSTIFGRSKKIGRPSKRLELLRFAWEVEKLKLSDLTENSRIDALWRPIEESGDEIYVAKYKEDCPDL